MEFKHRSVLLNETIDGLNIKEDGIYVDCTLGGGGHSNEILKKLSKDGRLIGIDQDTEALKAAKERLSPYENVIFIHDNFYNIKNVLENINVHKIDGVVMDLGVSSYQLDKGERGFSYNKEAPLDMRMNRESTLTAYDVVNGYSEERLYTIFKEYGEERFSKRIANFIVNKRKDTPINTTFELVDIIKKAIPIKYRREGHHPAKKTFQAIRIEVNKELEILEKAITDSVDLLNEGGRISIITFHSLEDRIVKNCYKALENPCTCPKEFPICICGNKQKLKQITKKPIGPSEEELEVNPRSRSAKLRVGERI